MNSKRKADLQRKLSLAQVPTPPAGLAERLKNDIPTYLPATTEQERERFSRSIGFNLRVAASILLMISSVYLTLRIMSRSTVKTAEMVPNRVPTVTPSAASSHIEPVAQKPASAPTPQPTIYVLEGTTVIAPKDQREEAETKKQPASRLDDRELVAAKPSSEPGRVSEPPASNEAEASAGTERTTRLAEGFAAPGPELRPAPPPPAEAPVAGNMGGRSATRVAPAAAQPPTWAPAAPQPAAKAAGAFAYDADRDLVKVARAADLSFAAPDALFGISVDHRAFDRVKNIIERGERPEVTEIDVDALVNYFAGRPLRPPREVELEAEGSPAPVPVNPLRQLVRFTVDSAWADVSNGGSAPPAASDVKIEITFDPRSVASHRRIGGDDIAAALQSTLLKNASVTALYEVELRQSVPARGTIATVRLTYRSVADGHERTIERALLRQNLVRTWTSASRRHRLASLGAIWGETLKGNASGLEVARRAEELAHQSPNDSKARELADVASASSRLRNTPTTGSGR